MISLLPTFSQAHAPEQESMAEEIDGAYNLEQENLSNYVSLTVDWGISSLLRSPQNMDLFWWRSRVLGANLYYNIPIKSSHFVVSCGAGISNVDYLFKDGQYTIGRDKSTRKTSIIPTSNIVPTGKKANKSELSIWNTDFIIELKFDSNKEEPREGFFVAVGANVGYQFSPATSIHYKEDDENKKWIIYDRYNLSKPRYGVLLRMGWERFGAFYHQTLSPIFNDQGPAAKSILPFSVGVSVNLL